MRTKTQLGNLAEHLVLNLEAISNQLAAVRYSLVGSTEVKVASAKSEQPDLPHPGNEASLQAVMDYWAVRSTASIAGIERDLAELSEFAETGYATGQKAAQGR